LAQCSQEIPCTLEALKLLFEKSNDFLTHKLIENDNNFISESSLLLALLNQKTGQAF
jgi:hypothetical protein